MVSLCRDGFGDFRAGPILLIWVAIAANEICSGFEGVKHNNFLTLLAVWIIPRYVHRHTCIGISMRATDHADSSMWLVFPIYMIYDFSISILKGLAIASGDTSSAPAKSVTPSKDD